jgi:diguanylate cyclase (GGDEF)-like protein
VRHGTPLSALLLDVDHFKAVNDRHGHAAGDEVLRVLAGRLRVRLRLEDACGRWGGEEFLVLLRDTPADAAEQVAQELLAVASGDPVRIEGDEVRVTLSIGVARWDGDSADGLLRCADAALYAAKAAGRAIVRAAAVAAA